MITEEKLIKKIKQTIESNEWAFTGRSQSYNEPEVYFYPKKKSTIYNFLEKQLNIEYKKIEILYCMGTLIVFSDFFNKKNLENLDDDLVHYIQYQSGFNVTSSNMALTLEIKNYENLTEFINDYPYTPKPIFTTRTVYEKLFLKSKMHIVPVKCYEYDEENDTLLMTIKEEKDDYTDRDPVTYNFPMENTPYWLDINLETKLFGFCEIKSVIVRDFIERRSHYNKDYLKDNLSAADVLIYSHPLHTLAFDLSYSSDKYVSSYRQFHKLV